MKRIHILAAAAVLALGIAGASWQGLMRPAEAQSRDYYPELAKKIVPIITVGSNLNVGAAQVAGSEDDVDNVKAVAQLETDYKDVARIKILVPVKSQNLSKIDRAPGVSVIAIADVNIK
jgi:hypothetical protein